MRGKKRIGLLFLLIAVVVGDREVAFLSSGYF